MVEKTAGLPMSELFQSCRKTGTNTRMQMTCRWWQGIQRQLGFAASVRPEVCDVHARKDAGGSHQACARAASPLRSYML